MKLLERYATECGLKIGPQDLLEHFFPLPFERYITLHAASGMAGKNYPYYHMVIELIKPYLDKAGISIVQIGGKDEAALAGCHHTQGKTNMHQAGYLVHNAMCHLGNDSIWGHRAGYLGIPLVQPWGTTDPKNHAAYTYDPKKTIFLESHRFGRRATFAAQENPSTIALIPPETVAESVLKLIGVEHPPFARTQYIGNIHQHTIVDVIPGHPVTIPFGPEVAYTMRMDIAHDEQALLSTLQTGRKVTIVTKKHINLNILASFKPNILSYSHEIDETCPLDYPQKVRAIIQQSGFFSRSKDENELAGLRFRYFDCCFIEQVAYSNRDDYLRDSGTYLNKTLDKDTNLAIMEFKTNKFILSNGKVYLSYAHEAADQSVPADFTVRAAQVIDNELFWRDYQHYLVYANTN